MDRMQVLKYLHDHSDERENVSARDNRTIRHDRRCTLLYMTRDLREEQAIR